MLEMQFYFLLYYIAIQIWPCCTEIWAKYFLKGKNNNLLQFWNRVIFAQRTRSRNQSD